MLLIQAQTLDWDFDVNRRFVLSLNNTDIEDMRYWCTEIEGITESWALRKKEAMLWMRLGVQVCEHIE